MGTNKIAVTCLIFFWLCLPSALLAQAVQRLAANRVASGLTEPLFVTAPPGDFNRLFIVRKTGQVHILNLTTGTLNARPYLDIHLILSTMNLQGLLGMAFDPNYATNGKFYLNFTVPGGAFSNGVTHVSQYQVSADPDIADTSNERILLTFDQPETDHNGGWIGFSPRAGDENNLYIATGDGGAANDQGKGHIEPGGNAQNTTTLLGKMLRIHVDSATGTYTIPPNNPFFGSPSSRREIWAYGLRNPFRDSFDRLNGRMFIADVGQDTREEVDAQEASNPGGGENYEWRLREGFIATPTGDPPVGGPRPPGGIDPIIDYPRSVGGTVIGGYVYRGSKIPALQGTYVFGDYLIAKIFSLNYDGVTVSKFQTITSQLFPIPLPGGGTVNLANPSSFGEGANGELYITDIGNGNVYKIVPALAGVVSRKTHGSAGTFDINLPTAGLPGVECRTGGASGNYTMIFSFANPLGSVGGSSVTAGIGSVSSSMINSSDTHQYIVNLTGLTNIQVITVSLTNVTDATTRSLGTVSASMGVLIGDTTGNGTVNSTDISLARSQSGNVVTGSNFREDVTANGFINSADVSLIKSRSGTALP